MSPDPSLQGIKIHLQHMKRDCTATVVLKVIRAPMGERTALSVDPNCDQIYLDVTKILMMSRMLQISDAVGDLVRQGKEIFIACGNQEGANEMREMLAHINDEKVKIFIEQ